MNLPSRRAPMLRLMNIILAVMVFASASANAEHEFLDTFVTSSPSSEIEAPNCTDVSKTDNRLSCWLWQLRVFIPKQSFEQDYVTVDIDAMICSNFMVSGIESTYVPSSASASSPTLGLAFSDIFATCTGKYRASGGFSGNVRASVFGGEQGLDVAIQVQGEADQQHGIVMPHAINTSSCTTDMIVPHNGLFFSGSLSARFINIFSKPIRRWITSALETQVCPLIRDNIDEQGTDLLTQAQAWLEQHMSNNGMSAHLKAEQSSVQAVATKRQLFETKPNKAIRSSSISDGDNESPTASTKNGIFLPVIKTLLTWSNQFLENHLSQGFLFDWVPAACDEQECGYFFRGVAGAINHFTNGKIPIRLPPGFHNMTFELPYGANLTLGIFHVQWSGIDKLDNVLLMIPTTDDAETLLTHVDSSNWNISTHIKLQVDTKPGSMFYGEPLEEEFEVTLSLREIYGAFHTAITTTDWDDIAVLQVVQAVRDIANDHNRRQGIGCLVSQFTSLQLLEKPDLSFVLDALNVSPSILKQTKGSSLEADLDNVLNTVIKLVAEEYAELMASVIQGLAEGSGRDLLNTYLHNILATWSADPETGSPTTTCPTSVVLNHPQWLNFSQVKLLNEINAFLNYRSTIESSNQFLSCFSRLLFDHRHLHDPALRNLSFGEDADSSIKIRELSLMHFDSLQHLQVLQPLNSSTSQNLLQSSVAYAHEVENTPELFMSVEIESPEFDVTATMNFTVLVGEIALSLGNRIEYDLNQLANLTVASLLSHAQCAAVPMAEFRFVPSGYDKIGKFESATSISVKQGNAKPIDFHVATQDYPIVKDALASVLDWSWQSAFELVNKATEKLVVHAPNLCSNGDANSRNIIEPKADEASHWSFLCLVGILCLGGQVAIFSAIRSRRAAKANISANDAPEIQPLLEDDRRVGFTSNPTLLSSFDRDIIADIHEDMHDRILEDDTIEEPKPHALFCAKEVPAIVRHLVPITIMCTIIMLLSGNLSVGATVDIKISLGDDTDINLPGLFGFSLGHTIQQLYAAGIYPLLFLVVGFSGLWPYGKLLLMLRAWVVPTARLHKRERILLTLDALGKFSLVDTYVLVLFMVAFRYHLQPTDDLTVDVFVTPHRGFYGFLLATSISLLLGHLMIFYHRKCDNDDSRISANTTKETILGHQFEVSGGRCRMSRFLQAMMFLCVTSSAVLMCIGFTQESFIFEFGGAAGAILGEEQRSQYSLITIGSSLAKSVENSHGFGILAIQCAFFFYAVVTPLLCLILLMILMVYPMSTAGQRKILILAEIANAWSAVEVFALSIIAALLQISTFANFMVGDKCDIINSILENVIPTDPTCFSVNAYVASNCWYLVAGVILNSATVSFLLRLANCAINERVHLPSPSSSEVQDGESKSIMDKLHGSRGRCVFLAPVDVTASEEETNAAEEEAQHAEWRFWF